MRGYPQFSFWISIKLVKICFSRIFSKTRKNIFELVGTALKFNWVCRRIFWSVKWFKKSGFKGPHSPRRKTNFVLQETTQVIILLPIGSRVLTIRRLKTNRIDRNDFWANVRDVRFPIATRGFSEKIRVL